MSVSSGSITNSGSINLLDSQGAINDVKFPPLRMEATHEYENVNDVKPLAPNPVRPRNPRERSLESPRKKLIQPAVPLEENASFISSMTTLDRLDELSYDDSSIIEKKETLLQKVGIVSGIDKKRGQRKDRKNKPPLISVDDVNGSPFKQKNLQNKKTTSNVTILSTEPQALPRVMEHEENRIAVEAGIDDTDRMLNAYAINRGKFKLGKNAGFEKERRKSVMGRANPIFDINSVELKAAAWKLKYYIELFRHKFNKSVFIRMKDRFNATFTDLRQ